MLLKPAAFVDSSCTASAAVVEVTCGGSVAKGYWKLLKEFLAELKERPADTAVRLLGDSFVRWERLHRDSAVLAVAA